MRINIIEPSLLADQHLVAEYREIKMLPKALIRSINSKKGLDTKRISKTYILNTGHGYFFYDKIGFIVQRFNELIIEMKNRGFSTNYTKLELNGIPKHLFNSYIPNNQEILINLERIEDRISDKPNFYKYRGSKENWDKFYSEYRCKLEDNI